VVRVACGVRWGGAPRSRISGAEPDDLAYQAPPRRAAGHHGQDGQFQGESRFTTGAYKFVIFEVSAKIGRHFGGTGRAAGRLGLAAAAGPVQYSATAQELEWRDLLAALRRAVDEELTRRPREVFVAVVVNQVPLDDCPG
jgi:RNA polymerase sigma-70 factor, ECF subfamily